MVLSVDVLNKKLKVKYQDDTIVNVEAKDCKIIKQNKKRDEIDKELKELEG